MCAGDTKILPADCRADGCGKGANCVPLLDGGGGGAYVCQCPPGTVGSPQTECALGKCFFFLYFFVFIIIKYIPQRSATRFRASRCFAIIVINSNKYDVRDERRGNFVNIVFLVT